MSDPLPQSILCPVLIGRDAQVAVLTRLLEQARTGQGQIMLISGEAGIGKSRLVTEISAAATRQGVEVVRGSCFETDRTLPYALVLDLLRSYPDGGKRRADLLDWLAEQRNTSDGQGEEGKRRWFEVLLNFLVTARPQLIVCEDLHWSDDASLELLALLARQIAQQPLLLLLTYRPDECTPSLTRLLALLERQRLAGEVVLAPLNEVETDQMVRTLFQQTKPIRSEFLYTIHSLSDGNPFFIEEILKSLVTSGDIFPGASGWERKPLSQLQIPRTVQAAVQSRLGSLSAEVRRVLRLAAVAGRRFDFALLQQITGSDELTLIETMRQLIHAQLVVEESAERFTFRHALIREAIYNDLLQRERSALHQSIASALEQMHPPPTAPHNADPATLLSADLAYHFHAAGQWQKALHYAQQAGEWAQRLDAPRAAMIHFTRAIEAAQQLEPKPLYGHLLVARAQAAERLGEFESARSDYEAALAAARANGATQSEWQNLLALGFLWTARSYQQADGYFQAALHLAHQSGDPPTVARSLNRVGNWYLNADEPQTALTYHHEALACLPQPDEQPPDQQAIVAETLDLVGTATYYSGDLRQAIHFYQAAIPRCRTLDQRSTLVSVLLLSAVASGPNYLHDTLHLPPPNQQAAEQAAQEALTLCRTMQWRPREAFVLAYLAWRNGAQGHYAQAFADAQRALTLAGESEFHRVAAHLALALLHLDVGASEQAQQLIEAAQRLAEQVGALMIRRFVDATQARILIAQGRQGEAEALLQRVCPPEMPMQTPPQRLLWLAWAEWGLASGQPANALTIVQNLVTVQANTVQSTPDQSTPDQSTQGSTIAIPLLQWMAGEALLRLRRFAEAEESLQQARTAATAHGALPLVWRCAAALARLYRSQRRSVEVEEMIATVHTIAQQLATQLPADALRQALLRLVAARLPDPKTPTPRQSAKQAYAGLTTREREVALLVAQGKTNLEIAHTLTLTERTVESHVSNILAKLAFTNRSQIAAWTVAKGVTR